MASGVYNRGKAILVNGDAPWDTADVRCALVTSSYTPNADHDAVSDLTNELSGGGYARGTLAGKTVTEDDTNDRVLLDATDQTFSSLGAAAGTPAYAIVYLEGASDAARQLIAWIELTTPPAPNGGNYTIVWSSSPAALISLT